MPTGSPFLACVARAMLAGDLPVPGGPRPSDLELADYLVLLPTRRAARAMQEAFLDAAGGRGLLLPAIQPIAEGNENLSLLSSLTGVDTWPAGPADVAPAVGEMERRLVLTTLVQRWSAQLREPGAPGAATDRAALAGAAGASNAAQAAGLAAELARLIDEAETEDVSLSGLEHLVGPDFSEHWQLTLQFLQIVLDHWPAYLAAQRVLSPMQRRNCLIRAQAAQLAARPPNGPVIVAGVTGSIPATADLMRAVAQLPHGAIVLPGLDQRLDEPGWRAVSDVDEGVSHPEHPHFAMKRLLAEIGVERHHVQVLAGAKPTPQSSLRASIVSEALRPAGTLERWHDFARTLEPTAVADALQDVSLIEAPTVEAEAEVIALIVRQCLETPGQTAALVSPDRLLARRVIVRLESWGIRVDDSAGRPLAKTMPGAFLELVIQAWATNFSPQSVVMLLKQPLARLALPAGEIRRAARALEIAAFRTLFLGTGLDGVRDALERARQQVAAGQRRDRAVRGLRDHDWQAAENVLTRLEAAYRPWIKASTGADPEPLRAFARAHVASAEQLARLPEGERARGLWAEEAGEAAALFFAGLLDEDLPPLNLRASEYPDLYRGLIAGQTVRSQRPLHPRLAIWGPMEARLQQPDVVILGGLNENTWPDHVDPGPWLNRPMREQLGLPSPEQRIGHAAHDFMMLMGAPTVYVTRALKVDGVPAVPSRWLLRLNALADLLQARTALEPRQPWLAWAAWRNHVEARVDIAPPAPRPAVDLRPRQLSVTRVETWIANPYAIFAREILKLEPLPAIGAAPDAAVRGSMIHAALSDFANRFREQLPADIAAALIEIAQERLRALSADPRVAAFWLPRFERFADWFADTEPDRRQHVVHAASEVIGRLVLAGPAGPFTLTARADRIDWTPAGALITDYKTAASLGKLRTNAQSGLAPQLALEAAIALAGGFDGPDIEQIAALTYISASGGDPAGEAVQLTVDDFARLARDARQGLERLIAEFDDPDTPYRALRRRPFDYAYDDYAHLARVAEWSGAEHRGDGDGADEEGSGL